jgi:superfamily II DNA or RNA helicase
MIPKGYVSIDRGTMSTAMREKVKQELTIVPYSTSSFQSIPDVIKLWKDDGNVIGVPRGYYLTQGKKYGLEGRFNFSAGAHDVKENKPISLRPGQEDVISGCIKLMRQDKFGGAIAEARVGSGKSVIGMEIARRIGLKTLVVVHSSVLMDQWMEEVPKFLPNWSVGKIRADKFDVAGKDICVGIIHSLAMKDYFPQFYEEFGLIIFDECHICSAPEFSKAFQKFNAKYFLGLSGTLSRSDRTENVFKFGIGPVFSGLDIVKNLEPHVYFVDTSFSWNPAYQMPIDRQKMYLTRELITSPVRNKIIIDNAIKAASAGRHVLILSERVPHVEELTVKLREALKGTDISVGMLVGSSKPQERKDAMEARIIVATVQLIGVGFNVPRLDTLIFATPCQAIQQPCGRVLRLHDGKKQPIIIDLVDSMSDAAMALARSRLKKYSANKWKTFGMSVFNRR